MGARTLNEANLVASYVTPEHGSKFFFPLPFLFVSFASKSTDRFFFFSTKYSLPLVQPARLHRIWVQRRSQSKDPFLILCRVIQTTILPPSYAAPRSSPLCLKSCLRLRFPTLSSPSSTWDEPQLVQPHPTWTDTRGPRPSNVSHCLRAGCPCCSEPPDLQRLFP